MCLQKMQLKSFALIIRVCHFCLPLLWRNIVILIDPAFQLITTTNRSFIVFDLRSAFECEMNLKCLLIIPSELVNLVVLFIALRNTRPVVFNLFHTVANFPTQGNLTTYFAEQNLISVTKI